MTDTRIDDATHGGIPRWPCAYGAPEVSGTLRTVPEDFQVDEILGFEPDGDGPHVLLQIRKRDTNTEWLARELARFAAVRPVDVGFAGLKDRHALTTQWFSVHLGKQAAPDWAAFNSEQVTVLATARHRHKLRRGELQGNRFMITLRGLVGKVAALPERLERVRTHGVPNYFGAQRFGIEGGNLARAAAMFEGRLHESDRHKRGLYLSAARSLLFNEVLARRVTAGNWDCALPGEALMLARGGSVFDVAAVTPAIEQRVAAGELLPTGPLWGRGLPPSSGAALALEQEVLAPYAAWCRALEHAGLQQERRPLRLSVAQLHWEPCGEDTLVVRFTLPAGTYATTVLHEVVDVTPAPRV